ncbi:PTS lactose/cellobiose transporter subunit IIA [Oceanivirga salmonicida]|uniref:PTS lactose/cellobiose transporter subunit IIA n=1 Tax=Oceanivirga salmonicida TaxID=1769291 RepID=UPI000835F8B1|nr:PTS lactose/cellobiose transporter subunit IIA [Oceanivirga salmonicida]
MENIENMEEIIFEIISYSGVAKSLSYQAMEEAENGKYEDSKNSLKEADEHLIKAHEIQTKLIHAESNDEKIPLSVLFIHAQDHLMSAIEIRTLSENIIKINKRLNDLENNL